MNISAWKVSSRLSVGFGAVCALMLLIVVIGLSSMHRIQDGMTEVVNDRVPKIDAVNTVRLETNTIAIALRNMMLTSDAADRQQQIANITQARQVLDKNMALLDRLVDSPTGKELLQRVQHRR
jgi:methyl-accepting chemotaxis protein